MQQGKRYHLGIQAEWCLLLQLHKEHDPTAVRCSKYAIRLSKNRSLWLSTHHCMLNILVRTEQDEFSLSVCSHFFCCFLSCFLERKQESTFHPWTVWCLVWPLYHIVHCKPVKVKWLRLIIAHFWRCKQFPVFFFSFWFDIFYSPFLLEFSFLEETCVDFK